jgi:hypothetical protein
MKKHKQINFYSNKDLSFNIMCKILTASKEAISDTLLDEIWVLLVISKFHPEHEILQDKIKTTITNNFEDLYARH